jgi:1,2-diacylglycerol 3-alpha-glucosyltransferase
VTATNAEGRAVAPGLPSGRPLRLAVIVNMVAPYTKPLFERIARSDECELLVVSETTMERDRRWEPERNLPFDHVLLDSWTLDLAWLAAGSGFRTRFDTYLYVPKRPLGPLAEFRPDVVVAGGSGIWSSPANIAALAARQRRGWAFVPWWGSFDRQQPTWPRRVANPWVRRFMRTADACLAYGSRHVRDLVAMGVDEDRVAVAPITALVPDRMPERTWPRSAAETRFLFVGRLIERKGLEVLLQAFARFPGGELWIAGDGPLRQTAAAAASQGGRIRLLGHVDGKDLPAVYAQVDALVVPSLYEPWGLVVHEGLGNGLPVIASNQVAAADDLVEGGVNGYVVPAGSADALASAMRDLASWSTAHRERAGDRSQELVAKVSLERGADGFLRGARIAMAHRVQVSLFPKTAGSRADDVQTHAAYRQAGAGREPEGRHGLARERVGSDASAVTVTSARGERKAAFAGTPSRRPLRLAVVVNMVAPYTKPLFEQIARSEECELLVVSETTMERDRRWAAERDFNFEHVLLDSWTLDFARFAIGSGFRTRFDTYVYLPKRPLRPLVKFSPDVVVAAGGGIWSSPADIAALMARARWDWAVVPWWGSFTREKPTWPRRIANPWVRHYMRTADACLAYGTRHLNDLVTMGVDRNRIVIAPISAMAPDRPPARTWPRAGSETRFLFVGRLIESKGLDVLLNAFERFRGGELWIVGDGPLQGVLNDAAKADPRIRMLGYVEGKNLPAVYADVDALVLPSLYEPWGLVVHEGLANGLPAIVTDQVGSADDLVESGVNGYVVPAGSVEAFGAAMRDLASWSQEQRQLSLRHSAETIRRCSVERVAQAFLRAAEIALEHRRGR